MQFDKQIPEVKMSIAKRDELKSPNGINYYNDDDGVGVELTDGGQHSWCDLQCETSDNGATKEVFPVRDETPSMSANAGS
jgi:hypothetical protein